MPFSLRECKDRKKGWAIPMMLRNIFAVRLLAPGNRLSLGLGGTPAGVLFLTRQRALQGKKQKENNEGQSNLSL